MSEETKFNFFDLSKEISEKRSSFIQKITSGKSIAANKIKDHLKQYISDGIGYSINEREEHLIDIPLPTPIINPIELDIILQILRNNYKVEFKYYPTVIKLTIYISKKAEKEKTL